MPNAPIHQADIKRAVKAVQATGIPVDRVDVAPDGTVSIYSSSEKNVSDALTPHEKTDEADDWV